MAGPEMGLLSGAGDLDNGPEEEGLSDDDEMEASGAVMRAVKSGNAEAFHSALMALLDMRGL